MNLEKRHFIKGLISHLKIGENEFVNIDEEILNQCHFFFHENLYKFHISKQDLDNSTCNLAADTNLNGLSEDKKENCEVL